MAVWPRKLPLCAALVRDLLVKANNPHLWVTRGCVGLTRICWVGRLGFAGEGRLGFVALQPLATSAATPRPHVITCGSSRNPKFALFALVFFNIPGCTIINLGGSISMMGGAMLAKATLAS